MPHTDSNISEDLSTLPSQADVVVIGGGVMGCSTLYHLAKEGVGNAVLLERNKLTSGTTWHSAAQVRALRSTQNLTNLIKYSISLYQALEEETGLNVGWINKGSLSIATNPDRLTHIRRQEALAGLYGVEAVSVSTEEAKDRWPLMHSDDVIGAVWSPDDGRVSPSDLCAALIKGARKRGASIFEDTGVTGIITEGNKIKGVETSRGVIATKHIALCTGLWSRQAAQMAGVEVPVWPCEHFYLLTRPIDGIFGNMPTLSDHDRHLYIRDDSGGLLVGCFEPMGKPIDPDRLGSDFAFQLLPEDWDHFEPMLKHALHRLPVLQDAEVKMLLNGPESFTPDGSFLLGESAETQGFYLGCGMNSVGVATGGGAGWALAHNIVHGAPPMDLHEADPKRFDPSWSDVAALSARVPEVLGKHYEITYPGRQWATSRGLRHLPLHQAWQTENAYFGQAYGYERPLYFDAKQTPTLTFDQPDWFDQVGREVNHVSKGIGVTDLSSFGKIDVTGKDALTALEWIMSNRIDRPVGSVIYSLMLNEKGCILSDLTIFRLDDQHFRLYVGTAALKRDLAWIKRQMKEDWDVSIHDVTLSYATLGLMGSDAANFAVSMGANWLNEIAYFCHAKGEIAGFEVMAGRLSYVGAPGWEITCASSDSMALYQFMKTKGVKPVGAFAQSAMRIEKQFLSYGHDIDTDNTPEQLGLMFAVKSKTPFIGLEAVKARAGKTPEKNLATLIFDQKDFTPIGNEPVLDISGQIIGKTTSASFGYRVGAPIALALLKTHAIHQDAKCHVNIAGNLASARISQRPAFDPDGNLMRSKL